MKVEDLDKLPKELRPTFYPESPQKIFWLSIITGNLYHFIWFFRHWRHFKRRAIELSKLNIKIPIKCHKDKDIIPFWSSFFLSFYIIGIARRIRDRLKIIGFRNWATGPWWAFWLYGLENVFRGHNVSDDNGINISLFLLNVIGLAISSWQITRLQIKANQSIILSKELENIPETKFNKWDLFFMIVGLIFLPIIISSLLFV
tara:strand:+ start:285 stop:890 length:606 start_codon:yes stop_codon:yes gene_type:complete